ncbi:putative ribonuclease H-like domain-containing protein [Tanacetum coccineum]
MNYKPVVAGNHSNSNAGIKACNDAGKARMETVFRKDYILLPLWTVNPPFSQSTNISLDAGFKPSRDDEKKDDEDPRKDSDGIDQENKDDVYSTNNVNAASTNEVNAVGAKTSIELLDDPNMPELEYIVYSDDDEDVGVEANMNNLDAFIPIRSKLDRGYAGRASTIQITRSLDFARLVAQGYTQEEGIDYNEVFAPIARIEAIRLFLAYASFKDFVVYQMDVKSAFLYGKIEEEVYVCQPPGFEDPDFPDRVYKVEKALYGLHQAPRAWYETLSTYLLDNGFQRGKIDKTLFIRRDKGLQVKQKEDGIFISQDKYVTKILKKFGFTDVKTASTPMETQKPLLKDEDGEEVDVYLYRSMIGSLMYLTSSRPDIMFVYPKDSPFDLVAYTDSDYAGASLDRMSTTGAAITAIRIIPTQLSSLNPSQSQPTKGNKNQGGLRREGHSASAATISNVELTLAQTLGRVKSARPKTKGVMWLLQVAVDKCFWYSKELLIIGIDSNGQKSITDARSLKMLLTKDFDVSTVIHSLEKFLFVKIISTAGYTFNTAELLLLFIVRIKRLLDNLRVTAAKFRVNAAGTKLQLLKVTTAERIKTAQKR